MLKIFFPDLSVDIAVENLELTLYLVLFAFLPAAVLSGLFVSHSIQLARRYAVLARPSARGSHDVPTPRLGGAGAALAFYLSLVLVHAWWPLRPAMWYAGLLIGGGWALIGGLLDDIFELPPRWKFLFQFAAAGSLLALGYAPHRLELLGVSIAAPPWAMAIALFFFVVFFMNAFNFMDGMDGLSGSFGLFICTAIVFATGALRHYGVEMLAAMALGGACLGFLLHNMPWVGDWHKTFMGDSGSQFIGFLLAVLLVRIGQVHSDALPLTASFMLLSPFLWDVCLTLCIRLAKGHNIFQAHRMHLYQRLLIARWSHAQVLLLNLVWWAGTLVFALHYASAIRQGMIGRARLLVAGQICWLVIYTFLVMVAEHNARRRLAFPVTRPHPPTPIVGASDRES